MTLSVRVPVMGALGPRRTAVLEFPGDEPPTAGEVVGAFLRRFGAELDW